MQWPIRRSEAAAAGHREGRARPGLGQAGGAAACGRMTHVQGRGRGLLGGTHGSGQAATGGGSAAALQRAGHGRGPQRGHRMAARPWG